MVNSRAVWIAGNEFNRFNGDADLEENDIFGISINASQQCAIATNTFYDFGTGIRMLTDNLGTALRCNKFFDNHQSIRLGQGGAAATLTDQGTPDLAWDNEWWGNGATYRIFGSSNTFYWYFRNSGNDQFEPTNNTIFNGINNINATTDCPVNPPNVIIDRDVEIRPFIQDSVDYTDHETERRWLGYAYAYWALMDDTTLIEQSLSDDSIYVQFVSAMDTSNIGYFYHMERLVAENEYEDAVNLLSSITDTNTYEANLKEFYEIYLATYMQGIETDSSELADLTAIANQKYLEGGPAVWMARHLLELEIEDEYDEEELRMASSISPLKIDKPLQLTVGNPSNSWLHLYPSEPMGELVLEIYNNYGQLVLKRSLKSEELSVNVNRFASGLYFYNINASNNQTFSGKVIFQND